jgi:hypothetical protein
MWINVVEEFSQNYTRNMEQNSKLGGAWRQPWVWIMIAAVITVITVAMIAGAYLRQHQRSSLIVLSQQGMLIQFIFQ